MKAQKKNTYRNILKIALLVVFVNAFGLFSQQYFQSTQNCIEEYSEVLSPTQWFKSKLKPYVLANIWN